MNIILGLIVLSVGTGIGCLAYFMARMNRREAFDCWWPVLFNDALAAYLVGFGLWMMVAN